MHAALGGVGIAVMHYVRQFVETGLAEIVLDDFTLAPMSAHAVWPSGSRTPSRMGRFVDVLAQ